MELFRVFTKHWTVPVLKNIQRVGFLKPSDWLVVATLGIIMGLSATTMLAGVSLALTVPIPARGGTYTEGVIGSPRFINPLLAISDTDRDLTALVFSGLLKVTTDGSLSEDLAESYSISEDQRTYTFTLRNDARFHNGVLVTAEDVAFTVRSAQNPNVKSPRRADWEGVEVIVIDSRTISFTLEAPYALFLENMRLGILPKHLWESVTVEEFPFTALNTSPIGTGPYRVQSIRRNSSGIPTEYLLRAFTDGVRVPFISTFMMKFYPNEEALNSALNKGDIDAGNSINPNTVTASSAVYEAVFGRIFGIFFNHNQNTLFTDSTVRIALDRALDKERIVDTVLSGYGSVIDEPLPPERIIENRATAPSAEERIQEARFLLEEDGWKRGGDSVFEKTETIKGKQTTTRLAFSLSTANAPDLKHTAELVAESWKALGVDVSLKFFEQNDLSVEVIRPRRYDALLFGHVIGREPDLFAFWHSSQRNDPGLNIALYANTSTDAELDAARSATDPTERKEKIRKAAEEIANETAAIFLYAPHFVYLTPERVSGIILGIIAIPADRFNTVDTWYLSTERVWPVFNTSFETVLKNLTTLTKNI